MSVETKGFGKFQVVSEKDGKKVYTDVGTSLTVKATDKGLGIVELNLYSADNIDAFCKYLQSFKGKFREYNDKKYQLNPSVFLQKSTRAVFE